MPPPNAVTSASSFKRWLSAQKPTTTIHFDDPPSIQVDITLLKEGGIFPHQSAGALPGTRNSIVLNCDYDKQLMALITVRGGPVAVAMLVNNVVYACHPAIGEFCSKSWVDLNGNSGPEPRSFIFDKGYVKVGDEVWEAALRTVGISPSSDPSQKSVVTGKLEFRFWKARMEVCNAIGGSHRLRCWHCGDDGNNQFAKHGGPSTTLDIAVSRLREVDPGMVKQIPSIFTCGQALPGGYTSTTFLLQNYCQYRSRHVRLQHCADMRLANSKSEPIVLDDENTNSRRQTGNKRDRECESRDPPESVSMARRRVRAAQTSIRESPGVSP